MGAEILDGEALAGGMLADLASRAASLVRQRGTPPLLAVLAIGENPATASYAKKRAKTGTEAGVQIRTQNLPEKTPELAVFEAIEALGLDRSVDGILIETPLPKHLSLARLLERLAPEKDVEGLAPANYGRLFAAKSFREIESSGMLVPPTARAIAALLRESGISTSGAEAVVIGRSAVVGRPTAHLLSCLDATVVLCHSKTRNLALLLKQADIVVAAAGRPRSIRGKDLKPGAIVIDAGIAYAGKKLCGDLDFESAKGIAGLLTPVPGGVGPVTTAMLFDNVLLAAEQRA